LNYSTSSSSTDYKSIELVYIHELCFAGVVSLWRLYKRRSPIKIYFIRATQVGLKLAKLFVSLNILKEEPIKIDNLLFMDTPDCRYWSHLAETMNAGKKKSHEITKIIKGLLSDDSYELQNFLVYNIRKSWETPLAELMHLCLLAQLEANQNNLSLKKVVILSSFTPLFIHWGLKEKFSEVNLQFYFEIKFWMYNLGAFFINLRSFFEFFVISNSPLKKHDSKSDPARFGVEAAWGTGGREEGRMDDLFWWRNNSLPGNRVAYIYERGDIHPKLSEIENLKSLDIQPIVTNSKLAENWPQLYFDTRQNKPLSQLLYELVRVVKLTFKSISPKTLERRVISQVNWRLSKLNQLASTYNLLNIKGVFHHDESGFDDVTLACKFAGGARIGTHWSCFNGVCEVNRSHDVFFIWGKHDAKIIHDAGSVSKHLIISGCISIGNSKKVAYEKATATAKIMRSRGVKYLVSIFDCGVPMPNFNNFFLRWLLEDSCLGLLIKPKGNGFLNNMGSDLRTLYDEALKTGRVYLFDYDASPADAGRVSDFSVGIGGISAVVTAALHGARIFYLDYERLNQGPQKPYNTLHSLGEKRCVFYDPESLKQAVLEYIDNPKTNPDLGDASPVLNEFDSFRDGKASERIGEYISWYLEGLDKTLEKDVALQEATQRYAAKWGEEKVIRNTLA
jgi:hypothetical protein